MSTMPGLVQEGADLPSINPKFKYSKMALFRSRSEAGAMLRRSKSLTESQMRNRVRSCGDSEDAMTTSNSFQGVLSSELATHQEEDVSGGAVCLPSNTHQNLTVQDAARASPGFQGQRSKSEGKLFSPLGTEKLDKSAQKMANLSKRESLKVQKKHYRKEKKRAAKELLSTLKDPSVIVMADWLKVRGSLKSWTKLWCVLKPGLLILYKSHKQKTGHWVGTMLLNTCELIERPSKKDGFCFKLFHPLDQSIWATKGPKNENIGAITQPLPYSYLIFRAPSEAAGKCWMDALELALRCSSLLMRTMTKDSKDPNSSTTEAQYLAPLKFGATRDQMNESDCERHFKGHGLEEDPDADRTDREEEKEKSESESEHSEEEEEKEAYDDDLQPLETSYCANTTEELGQQGEACQTEEVADENKSLIWALVKQVRPGMDLSKVVLPTFILEPRSFLDKLSDYYYHADILSEAVATEDPFTRMKSVVRWYLSGFYKKPKGLKKPYNPILGETFRCYWKHPKTGSRTFYVAEQISHHPPMSAFYVTNRQDGFSISGSILTKSKFYGNSVSAIMDGIGRLTLLKRGEDYLITMPYAHCKGILIGTLTMELGGKVSIDCEKTGYRAELEFKLKPFLGTGEASNRITGKLKLGSETLATLDGHWDQEIFIKDKRTGDTELFWNPSPEVKSGRLRRYTVPMEAQTEWESEKLWLHVTGAIINSDQNAATQEKFLLEEAQRRSARERKVKMEDWSQTLFERDSITGDWVYKYADLRPWDPMNDLLQYEHDYVVQTKTRHRTPIVRTTSITNVDESAVVGHKRQTSIDRVRAARIKRASMKHLHSMERESGSSTPDGEGEHHSESSDSAEDVIEVLTGGKSGKRSGGSGAVNLSSLHKAIEPILELQKAQADKTNALQGQLLVLARRIPDREELEGPFGLNRDVFFVGIVLLIQVILFWVFK